MIKYFFRPLPTEAPELEKLVQHLGISLFGATLIGAGE